MKHRSWIVIAGISLAALAAAGAENAGFPGGGPGDMRGMEGRGRRGGGMRERMEALNQQLKEKFPAEYAELEKMRATDRMGAMRKMMELAQKAGVEMPFGRRGMMGRRGGPDNVLMAAWQKFFADLKEKAPEEFAAIEKKMATEPQNVMAELKALAEKHGLQMPDGPLPQGGRGAVSLNRNRNRFLVERANRILEQRRPEEYAKLQELRKTDDDAAREYFRKLAKEEGLTPRMLLDGPIRPVQSFSYSDKDIEERFPAPVSNQYRGWGGRGGFGGFGGFGGRGWRGR